MTGNISIRNQSKKITQINIEGIIGVPEKTQFEQPENKIATHEAFQDKIREISEIQAETIVVNIRSTGGNVNDALLIHDALAGLEAEIVTRCYGYVASAATIIAQAASKGKREISKNALYLIHQASSTAEGNSDELAQTIDLLGKTDQRIADVYAHASGKKAGQFIGLMKENNGKGRWLTPKETIENGLADKLIAPEEISNDARERLQEMNLPEIPQNLLEMQNKNKTFKKQWNQLIDLLKFESGDPSESVENSTGSAENIEPEKPENSPETPPADDPAAELDRQILQCQNPDTLSTGQEITDLQNRIVELEALNAKLRAKATQTLPKEDPSNRDIKRDGNAAAYENDMKNLLNS